MKMTVPNDKNHKPIVVAENVDILDGLYSKKTDLVGYSIGIPKFNNKEISAKVWRHTGERWSRQGEELPIHRVLDLAQLYLGSLLREKSSNFPATVFKEEIRDMELFDKIKNHYADNKVELSSRIQKIKELIDLILKL